MTSRMDSTRRRLLAAGGLTFSTALSGCFGGDDELQLSEDDAGAANDDTASADNGATNDDETTAADEGTDSNGDENDTETADGDGTERTETTPLAAFDLSHNGEVAVGLVSVERLDSWAVACGSVDPEALFDGSETELEPIVGKQVTDEDDAVAGTCSSDAAVTVYGKYGGEIDVLLEA